MVFALFNNKLTAEYKSMSCLQYFKGPREHLILQNNIIIARSAFYVPMYVRPVDARKESTNGTA